MAGLAIDRLQQPPHSRAPAHRRAGATARGSLGLALWRCGVLWHAQSGSARYSRHSFDKTPPIHRKLVHADRAGRRCRGRHEAYRAARDDSRALLAKCVQLLHSAVQFVWELLS